MHIRKRRSNHFDDSHPDMADEGRMDLIDQSFCCPSVLLLLAYRPDMPTEGAVTLERT